MSAPKLLVLCLALFCMEPALFGQAEGGANTHSRSQLWNEYNFSQGIARKWVAKGDINWSSSSDSSNSANVLKHPIDLGARAWLHYFVKPKLRLSASVGYWKFFEVAEIKQQAKKEFRITCDAWFFKVYGRNTLYNRLRYESRFIHNEATGTNSHVPRLRYQPKLFVALNGKSIRAKTYYLILADELFFNLGSGGLVDQNRASLGIGYCINNNLSLELTCVNRLIIRNNQPNDVLNAVSLSFTFNNFISYFRED